MTKIAAAALALLALALMGFTGCEGDKSAAPVADDGAWCKTKYTDQASCDADPRCGWKPANVEKNKPERCGAVTK